MKRREFLTAASVAGGGVAASASAVAAQDGTETPTGTQQGTPTEQGTQTPTGGGGGGGGNTWTVEMNDQNQFDPDSVSVRPGDTVVWENTGSADHTVTAYGEEIPDGADYWASGGFDSEDAATNGWPDQGAISGGETFEHTFQTEGTHQYFCIPHETAGMKGEVQVSPDAPTPTPEAAAGGGQAHDNPEHWGVPFQAHFVGAATALMVLVSIIYTFFVLKYGESPNTKGGND